MRGYVKRVSQKASKLSKEQLLELLDVVVDENDNLYSILESISTGLLIVDNDFCILYANQIVESRLSFAINLDDPRASMSPIWDIIDDEEISTYFERCYDKDITNTTEDFTVMTSGGSVRFLTITMTPLLHKGENTGRIILIRDVTDKKNQEVRLHRMENVANLTNLAAGMAHDIKNPLGAISIHIQLIQKALAKARENNDILPPKKFVEEHIDVVNEEISHLNELIMNFLFAVRPVNATLQLKNPAVIIERIVEFFKPEFNNDNISVFFESKDNEKKFLLDEKLLREVIMNLSQNALAAIKSRRQTETDENPSADYKGELSILCYSNENKYYIRIKDNGCGMKSETLAKIFEPYFTTKANGTGLGMTMVYKIVKEFSGEIQVESVENEGTEFIMSFPLHQDEKLFITNE